MAQLMENLPLEVLLQVTRYLNCFDLVCLSLTNRRLNLLIRNIVLFISDASFALPRHVANYQLAVFYYSACDPHLKLTHYLEQLAALPHASIVVVYLNKNASLRSTLISHKSNTNYSFPDYINRITDSIYLGDAEAGVLSRSHGSIMKLFGHNHYFKSIKVIPPLYVLPTVGNSFRIYSKSVESLENVNILKLVSSTKSGVISSYDFLNDSCLPNLRHIKKLSMESGRTLKMFEKFPHLTTLSIDSTFFNYEIKCSRLNEFIEQTRHLNTLLPNLKRLEIEGNSIYLSNIFCPQLTDLQLSIYGYGNSQSFNEKITIDNVQLPNLKNLSITTSNLDSGLFYIVSKLNCQTTIENLKISTSTLSSLEYLPNFDFRNLQSLSINSYIVSEPNYKPKPLKLNAPNLKAFNVSKLRMNNIFFLDPTLKYPGLKVFHFKIKLTDETQFYKFSNENFPDLEILTIELNNKLSAYFGGEIFLSITIQNLKKLFIHNELLNLLDSESKRNLANTEVVIINE